MENVTEEECFVSGPAIFDALDNSSLLSVVESVIRELCIERDCKTDDVMPDVAKYYGIPTDELKIYLQSLDSSYVGTNRVIMFDGEKPIRFGAFRKQNHEVLKKLNKFFKPMKNTKYTDDELDVIADTIAECLKK